MSLAEQIVATRQTLLAIIETRARDDAASADSTRRIPSTSGLGSWMVASARAANRASPVPALNDGYVAVQDERKQKKIATKCLEAAVPRTEAASERRPPQHGPTYGLVTCMTRRHHSHPTDTSRGNEILVPEPSGCGSNDRR